MKKEKWRSLYHVFAYIYSLLIEKDICGRRNVSVKLLCTNMRLLSGDLVIFSVRVPSFFSYFCVIRTPVLSLSTWSIHTYIHIYVVYISW